MLGGLATPAQGFVALHLHHTALTLCCAALHCPDTACGLCHLCPMLHCMVPALPQPSFALQPSLAPCPVPCSPLPFGFPAPSPLACCREHTDFFHLQRRGLILRALRW